MIWNQARLRQQQGVRRHTVFKPVVGPMVIALECSCGYVLCDCKDRARSEAKAQRDHELSESVERLASLAERRRRERELLDKNRREIAERAVLAQAPTPGSPGALIAQYAGSLNCTEKPFPSTAGTCAGCGFKCKECVC